MRDAIPDLIVHLRPFTSDGRDPAWLSAKLDRLCASPFGFLRGTFHRFVDDWPDEGDDPFGGSPQPIVGDLHVENFGAYKAGGGHFVFDVNDFDETAPGPAALDLCRLATSIVLADEHHGVPRAVERIGRLLEAYLAAGAAAPAGPVEADGAPPIVKALLVTAEEASRHRWLDKRVEGQEGARRFRSSDKYHRVEDAGLRARLAEAVRAFAAGCPERPADCPAWPQLVDAATRLAGTGSLGRFRYAILMPGKGARAGKELVLELKEARPSSLDGSGDAAAQAARVIAHERLLQGASAAYLGTTLLDGRPFTVRELQPSEAKIDSAALKPGELDELCAALGTVLGRAHRRGASDLPSRLKGRARAAGRRVTAFALRYAEIVCDDQAQLVARRAEVERAIGLTA